MKKKILVTGGSGFLGFNLIKKLSKKKQFEVEALIHRKKKYLKKIKNIKYIYCDISKYNNLKKKLNKKYDYIVNFSGNIDHKNNFETKKIHYYGLKNLIKVISHNQIKMFIQIGSSLEYGKKPSPQKESKKCKPISYYGKAKYLASNYLQKKIKNHIILRPYQIYGPFQKSNRLIPFIIKSCIKNKSFKCTDGFQLRDFLYIDDFTDLIIKILKKNKIKNKIYNVGYGKPIEVRNVINLIVKVIKKGKPLFGEVQMRKDESNLLYPNVKNIMKDFSWKPKVKILNGLKKTTRFYAGK